jgi:hypothetical protein
MGFLELFQCLLRLTIINSIICKKGKSLAYRQKLMPCSGFLGFVFWRGKKQKDWKAVSK